MSITQKLMSAAGKSGFDPNTPIGTFIEGGYFAGIIVQGGDEYALIVAPRASGWSISEQFKTSNTASPVETRTLNNGPAATAAMVAAGSHPAAAFCAGLNIGGFSDWYLPARDELELLYRNLKPTTAANATSDRPLSGITYPEGNDTLADTMGVNRNSNPVGAAYTTANPARTALNLFRSGGAESFEDVNYWSSSEFSNEGAWRQLFSNGNQPNTITTKTNTNYVRAIRRVAV